MAEPWEFDVESGESPVDQTMDEWLLHFKNLTYTEFRAAVQDTFSAKSVPLNLVVAIGRKLFEYGHFGDDLASAQRDEIINEATRIMETAIAISPTEVRAALESGWTAQKDFSDRFGYKSGAIYEVLAPYNVFRE